MRTRMKKHFRLDGVSCGLAALMMLLAISPVFSQIRYRKVNKERIPAGLARQASKVLDRGVLQKQSPQPSVGKQPVPALRESMDGWETIKSEGFEGAWPNDWELWGDPYWGDVTCRSNTDSWSAWCADDGTSPPSNCTEYVNDMSTWMIYGPFDLSDPEITDAELRFWTWFEIEEGYDGLSWMATAEGLQYYYGWSISGDSQGWVEKELDLTQVPINDTEFMSLVGEDQVWIAFIFESDYSQVFEGAYIDDVLLRKRIGSADPCIRIEPESLELSCEREHAVRPDVRPMRATREIDEKYIIGRRIDANGNEIVGIRVPGKPPRNRRAPRAVPLPSAVTLPEMPAFSWSFGCSATSAAMIAAYYDRSGFPNMYTGPTNGGVMPLDNSSWGTQVINGESRAFCPLSATASGVDGRTTRGHVDDYWVSYASDLDDPWITNGWGEHAWAECTADFMGTNQSSLDNVDGETTFWFNPFGSKTYDYTLPEPEQKDGCAGFRDFYESRGYTVTENYSQYIYGYGGRTLGFTFDEFMAEIDGGYPVIIQVEGHSMVGYGYDEATQNIYIHDTWDHFDHVMPWAGEYEGMLHYGVCVVRLEGVQPPSFDYFTVRNDCEGDLTVSGISSDADWCTPTGHPSLPFTLTTGAYQTFSVDVDWSQIPVGTSDMAVITITSNDPDDPTLDVFVDAANTNCGGECTITAEAGCGTYCEGSEITVPITVDLTESGVDLGSYTASLMWDPEQLQYVGYAGGTTSGWGAPTVNASDAASGRLDFSSAYPAGSSGVIHILNAQFDVIGTAGETGAVDLGFTAMAAASTFTDLMTDLCVEDCSYEIESCGILGDVNGDEIVNSTDALILLSCDVGQDVSAFCPMNCGDVNGDGLVNSTDALILLSHDVGLSVPYPVEEPGCPADVTPCPGCAP